MKHIASHTGKQQVGICSVDHGGSNACTASALRWWCSVAYLDSQSLRLKSGNGRFSRRRPPPTAAKTSKESSHQLSISAADEFAKTMELIHEYCTVKMQYA